MKMSFEKVIGLGVAGNFAGHLEQAGEAADFLKVKVNDAKAPKGIFPFYLPNAAGKNLPEYLSVYPITHGKLVAPANKEENLQGEPEVAILCDIVYEDGRVVNLIPKAFSPYNDCSIRRPGAKKISEKKNWGAFAKGVLPREQMLPIDKFTEKGILNSYKIASFHRRKDTFQAYGLDSFVRNYSYNYQQLIDWLIDKMNNQENSGPLENIHEYLVETGFPKETLISIGATRYTDFAEKNYLEEGDELYFVLYPETIPYETISDTVNKETNTNPQVLILKQPVTYGE